jgi:hypothetical protein
VRGAERTLPELEAVTLTATLPVAVIMLTFFWRKGWIGSRQGRR